MKCDRSSSSSSSGNIPVLEIVVRETQEKDDSYIFANEIDAVEIAAK